MFGYSSFSIISGCLGDYRRLPNLVVMDTGIISIVQVHQGAALFFKILILRAFYSPRRGDFKTVFIVYWDLYFSNILTSKFEIPCSKVLKIFFFNIALWRFKKRALLRHWTQISNNFLKILKIDCTGSKKAVQFGYFPKCTVFSRVNRKFFEKFSKLIRYLSSVFQYASFDTTHDYI